MRLRRLHIIALPGIHSGFSVEAGDAGLQLVIGPNASGKTTLIRALRAVLDPGTRIPGTVHVEAELETRAGPRRAVRLGDRVTWYAGGEEVAPPALPPPHLLPCYTLQLEDLTETVGTDREIGRQLVRDLAGGYDLAALSADGGPFRLKRNHAEAEARRHAEARRGWRERRAEHEALIGDEQRLETLEADYREAEQGRRRAEQLRRAADLAEALAEQAAVADRLAALPPGLAQLHGDELERLEQLEGEREQVRHRLEELAEAERACAAQLAESGLSDSAPEREALQRHRRLLQSLHERSREVRAAEEEAAGAQRRLAELATELGVSDPGEVRVDPGAVRALEEALDPLRQRQAQLDAIDADLARLEDPQRHRLPRAETVRAGRRELLHWLAARWAPRPGWPAALAGAAGLATPGALAGAVYYLEPGWQWHPGWAGAAAVGTACLAWFAARVLRTPEADSARDTARRRYPAELPPPRAWAHEDVRDCLEHLDPLLHAAERREVRDRRAAERQQQARELQRQQEALGRQARTLGSDPRRLDASTARYLQDLREWSQVKGELAAAQARRDARRADAERLRAEAEAFLAEWEASPGADAEVEALQAALDELQRRSEQRQEALRRQEDLTRQRQELERRAEEHTRMIERLYAGAGIEAEDRETLRQRLDWLPEWRRLQEEHRNQHAAEQAARRALEAEPALVERGERESATALRAEADDLEQRAGDAYRISAEIGSIRERIDRVHRERPLEHARAEVQQAREALEDRLEEALVAQAGSWLLADVREEHTSERQPEALRQAQEWLARFTGHRYRLRFVPEADGEGRFSAEDTEAGAERPLSALSTGTRMQLLLAVRVAFAREAERGREQLPLFLDEALTTTDRDRFAAVASALGTLAREEGRQVFYLSAQAHEQALWQAAGEEPAVTDLAAVRRLAEGTAAAADLAPPQRPEPPAPGDQAPADYAAALGVPPLAPWAGLGAMHLFHLLRDDLPLLHRLLQAGLERVGPTQGLLRSDAAERLLTPQEQEQLRVRIAVAEAWLEAYRIGRGQPVPGAALAAAEPLANSAFRDAVADLAESRGGDARELLAALGDKAIKGFQSRKIDDLREWLTEHGYLDEREPSTREDRLQRALTAASGALATGTATAADVRRWVEGLEAGLAAAATAETTQRHEESPA